MPRRGSVLEAESLRCTGQTFLHVPPGADGFRGLGSSLISGLLMPAGTSCRCIFISNILLLVQIPLLSL